MTGRGWGLPGLLLTIQLGYTFALVLVLPLALGHRLSLPHLCLQLDTVA